MRSLLVRLVSALCFLFAAPSLAAPPSSKPKLVVVISVDQFAAAVYARYRNDYAGGLKRLSSGIAFPVGYQSHAATETCPGHSTILSGDHPSHTGIVGNSWFERSTGTSPYCVSVPGVAGDLARGPQRMKATTLGDWLKQAHAGSRIVSISGKDRAAIMMAGHHPDLVAWWLDGTVDKRPVFGFQTSQYAGPAGREIQSLLQQRDDALARAWRKAPPQLWSTAVPDECKPLEKAHRFGDVEISGVVPPAESVQPKSNAELLDSLHASPLYDLLALDFAADMAERWKLGARPSPDLLAIGLSATDYIGHRFGPNGAEMCAQVHALDRSLGTFLERIDRLGVPYMVVLTADHGSVPSPERLREQGIAAQRVDTRKFRAGLNQHLRQVLNIGWDPINADSVQDLYVKLRGDPAFAARVRAETVKWLREQPEVDSVLTREEVAAAVPPRGQSAADLTLAERMNEGYDAERSPDIFVAFKKYTTLGIPHGSNSSVAGHGSPWDYDRQVPILFWWPGAPSETSPAAAETVDIAPTLARILEIATPAVDGHCLRQVTRCNRR